MADLRDALAPYISDNEADEVMEEVGGHDGSLQLAIVGRPNVGKSTLINRLVGVERVVTGPEPGVTRDSIAVEWTWRDLSIRLFDTAGMRRHARIPKSWSAFRCLIPTCNPLCPCGCSNDGRRDAR